MRRHLLAATLLLAPAFAAEIDPGPAPALRLMLDGLPNAANEAEREPAVEIVLRGTALKLEETKLTEVAQLLGGEVHTASYAETMYGWLCYAAPDAATGGVTLTWFFAVDGAALMLSGIGMEFAPDEDSEGCTRLDAPLGLATGLPGLGAPVADLGAAFGPATSDSGVPDTVAYIFGRVPDAPGLVSRHEAKYVLGDSAVVAFSLMSVVEME